MKTKLKVLIVDDEFYARERIKNLIEGNELVEVISECESGEVAIGKILKSKPDLIFLDIQLGDMTGFELLSFIPSDKIPLIIFISAHTDFALKAFDASAFDYLVKPFRDERFYNTLEKLKTHFNSQNPEQGSNDFFKGLNNPLSDYLVLNKDKIPVKQSGKIIFIDKSKIEYIKASGDYSEIYYDQTKIVVRETLSSFLGYLNENYFFRIHRSTAINLKFVKEVVFSNYGEIDVKLESKQFFRVSKSYKKEFQNIMEI